MKFQCGQCGKCYLIENAENISKKQTLRCIECGNLFFLQKDLAFSSSSRNSKLLCNRCGSLVKEGSACGNCSSPLNHRLREEFMIDNKEYEFFVVRKGRIRPKHGKRGMGKTVLLLAGTAALLGSVLFFLLPASKRDSLKGPILKPLGIVSRTETQVVLLRSGQIYYAEKVERDGTVIKITEKNGSVVTADEKDVLQIAKAVLED